MSQTQLPFFIDMDPEDMDTEFKTASEGRLPKNTENTISAFSNTEGGRIVFGVSPDGNKFPLSNKDLDKIQLDLASMCRGTFNAVITPEIKLIDGKVIAYIPPVVAELRPIFIKRKGPHTGTYIRIGSADVIANEDALKRFTIAASGGAETMFFKSEKYEDHFDISLVETFINQLNKTKENIYQSFTMEEILRKQKAINKQKDVTYFGLLAFSKALNLQEIVSPNVNIRITHYPGSTKVDENNFEETYLDNKEFNGNVLNQFANAYNYIKTRLPVRGTIDSTGKRRDYLIIPEVAIREALANSIAHRDYSTNTAAIQIDIFSNRVEIINPGGSLVPIEQLEKAPSATRNPLLMTYLKEIGITEQNESIP